MALTKYTFSVAMETANGSVGGTLPDEIRASSVVTSLDHVDVVGDVLDVWMKAELSSDDQTALTSVVGAHAGTNPEKPPQDVVTLLERQDKALVLASAEAGFTGNVCTLTILIPGTLGDMEGRLVAGGYGFTDHYGWNDRVTKAEVVDKDFVYAGLAYPATPLLASVPGTTEETTWADVMPGGVVLGSYVDNSLGELFRGWRLWADDGGQGGVDIDPLGGFGRLPSLAYLEITVEKTEASPATRAAVNLWWGKKE